MQEADIGHVHLRVADLDRAVAFYTDVIGMRVVLRHPVTAFLSFGDYHHHLALDSRGNVAPRAAGDDERAGLHHFAIRFPDERSLAAAIARVRDARCELKGADFTVSRGAFTRDPEGNSIELTCDRPRASWPSNWATSDGLGRWRPLDAAAIGDGTASAPSRFVTLAPGEGTAYWSAGLRMTVLVPSSATDGRVEVSELLCPPGFATPLHAHERQDETFRVLEGAIRYTCGDVTAEAGPGALLHLPRGVPHAFATLGDVPARLFHVSSPAGVASFHAAAGTPVSTSPTPPHENRDAIARAAAEHGIAILGPPPASVIGAR